MQVGKEEHAGGKREVCRWEKRRAWGLTVHRGHCEKGGGMSIMWKGPMMDKQGQKHSGSSVCHGWSSSTGQRGKGGMRARMPWQQSEGQSRGPAGHRRSRTPTGSAARPVRRARCMSTHIMRACLLCAHTPCARLAPRARTPHACARYTRACHRTAAYPVQQFPEGQGHQHGGSSGCQPAGMGHQR